MLNSLKRIIEKAKCIKYIPQTGIVWLSGDDELFELTPPLPITKFIYRCDKRFCIDSIISLWNTHPLQLVAMVSGSGYEVYLVQGSKIESKKAREVSLQKRQKKGGQSAVRIARLAEERRLLYTRHVVEQIETLVSEFNPKDIFMLGAREAVSDVIRNTTLAARIIRLHDTIYDGSTIHKLVAENRLLVTPKKSVVNEILEKVDRLLYGNEITQYDPDMIEAVYSIESPSHCLKEKWITISSSDLGYSKLIQFGGTIAVMYPGIVRYDE